MDTDTNTYRVTLDRPSRSKCPNAWARIEGTEEWLPDTFTAEHGTVVEMGGTVRRATRTERVRERVVIDETGSWGAWGGAGGLKIEVAE